MKWSWNSSHLKNQRSWISYWMSIWLDSAMSTITISWDCPAGSGTTHIIMHRWWWTSTLDWSLWIKMVWHSRSSKDLSHTSHLSSYCVYCRGKVLSCYHQNCNIWCWTKDLPWGSLWTIFQKQSKLIHMVVYSHTNTSAFCLLLIRRKSERFIAKWSKNSNLRIMKRKEISLARMSYTDIQKRTQYSSIPSTTKFLDSMPH